MFEFEKPRIEIAEMAPDGTYGKFVVEPGKRLWHNSGQLPEKNPAFFPAWRSSQQRKN